MSEMYLGQIMYAGFSFAPRGYASCLGQMMGISQQTALFSLLGTTFGGNGQSTFQLPHAGGRALLGQGQSPGVAHNYQMGEVSGSENTTLTTNQMPMHVHGVSAPISIQALSGVAALDEVDSPQAGASLGTIIDSGGTGSPVMYVPAGTTGTPVNLAGGNFAANTTVAGGSQPLSIMQPYLAVNALIVIEGLFPSRN